jgi:hypothetical protein
MSRQMFAKWWSGLSALKWVLAFLTAKFVAFIVVLLVAGQYSLAGFFAATLAALLLGGVIGTIPRAPAPGRDLMASAIYKVSDHMSRKYGVYVASVRLHTLGWVTEGIGVPTQNHFEPVRQRRRFTKQWREIQRVQDAASNTGRTLRNIRDSGR